MVVWDRGVWLQVYKDVKNDLALPRTLVAKWAERTANVGKVFGSNLVTGSGFCWFEKKTECSICNM